MHGTTSFLRYWLPVILWMILIFSASTDSMSSGQTSRIIGPLLRWLKPDISEAAVGRIVLTARKSAHLTEYAILALLFWRAWRNPARTGGGRTLVRFSAVPGKTEVSGLKSALLDSKAVPEGSSHLSNLPTAGGDPWQWADAFIAVTAAGLYAATDELHQYFVPSRDASFRDVLLDTAGAVVGILALWAVGRWRGRW